MTTKTVEYVWASNKWMAGDANAVVTGSKSSLHRRQKGFVVLLRIGTMPSIRNRRCTAPSNTTPRSGCSTGRYTKPVE